jgi:hypothetical protein
MITSSYRTATICIAAAAACVILFFAAYQLGDSACKAGASAWHFQTELAKSLLQIGTVTIIGGLIGAFIKFSLDDVIRRRDHERQDSQRRFDLVNGLIERSGSAYRDAKACRRRLRAAGLSRKFGAVPVRLTDAQWAAYCDELRTLNDIQLKLEQLKIESRTHPELQRFRATGPEQKRGKLYSCLRSMEKYLGKIVAEYEHVAGGRAAVEPQASLGVAFSALPRLAEFTDGSPHTREDTAFDTKFVDAHHELVDVLQAALEALSHR